MELSGGTATNSCVERTKEMRERIRDWRDSKVGKVFAFHSVELGLIPGATYGPLSVARSDP